MTDLPRKRNAMHGLFKRPQKLGWYLILTLALFLMPASKANAQFGGYGGYGWGGYGGWGWGGYGYPGVAYNYGYPGYGMGVIPVYGNYVMGAPGYGGYGGYGGGYGGYGGYGGGYGGYGYGFGGFGYSPGGIGMSGVGYWNPMFGVGLTPLGTQSYMMETRLLGRVPRAPTRYYGTAYRPQSSAPIGGQNRLPQ
jgi:hypothetical protein